MFDGSNKWVIGERVSGTYTDRETTLETIGTGTEYNLEVVVSGNTVTDHTRSAPLGLPVPVLVCILVLALVHFLLKYTVLGRSLYLLGSSPRAAYVAGVLTRRMSRPICLAYFSTKWSASRRMSSLRSRSGGRKIGNTLMR